MTTPEIIRYLRTQKGLKQSELAELSGINQRTISAYETDARGMSAYSAIKLSQALGISTDQLFGLKPLVETNVYDKVEEHENCTVQILRNTVTGEYSFGWRKNEK